MSPHARATLLAAAFTLAVPARVAAENSHAVRCGTGIHTGEEHGLVWLPQGDVFCQLVADPKAIRSFATYLRGTFPPTDGGTDIASVGIADGFGFFRLGGERAGDGLQLGVEAAVFAQFDLGTSSDELLNADYLIGFPLTFREGGFSGRARVYHQSSHLGDELLLRTGTTIDRLNLSFESAELMLSQELGVLRLYAGGEYVFNRHPSTLDPKIAHVGAELRGGAARGVRLVAAGDVKSTEQQDWKPAWSVRAGFEVAWSRSPEHPLRVWSILAEYYEGPSPYGQFFLESTRYVGAGFHFQL